jgi:Calcium-dependent channel, 7TM region, putative phosphate
MFASNSFGWVSVFWANVGRTHKDLHIGTLISLAATTAVCFLWTIPMTFIAGLQSADAIQEEFPFLEAIFKYPLVVTIIDLVAPLLVKIVNSLLPTILQYLSMFEGPVSGSVVVSSVFTKLASFMIIQTFFVQAIGGALIKGKLRLTLDRSNPHMTWCVPEIGKIAKNPSLMVDLLAQSLPNQSTFFVQIVFVGTTISMAMEMLRVVPFVMALIRRFLPPNLTEKEKQTTVYGIRPLADPGEFSMSDSLAQIVRD